jgi:transcriptional regulator with XRE-family HTH domain
MKTNTNNEFHDLMTTPLRRARLNAGLTALALSCVSGTTENRYWQIERGRFRPRHDEAQRLADVLRVPVDELFPNGIQSKGGRNE